VVISENSIGSPTVGEPSVLVALERTSLAKHGPTVRPGGLILMNASLIPEPLERDDLRIIGIPATEMADELGNPHVVNSIMLGAYVAATEAVALSSVAEAVRQQLRSRFHLIDVNMTALQRGADFVASHPPEVA
jgi:2-oxoglutarate ferredoxin oxidoreductase subunit gamma